MVAEEFAARTELGSVNLIIIDIADHLAPKMLADLQKVLDQNSKGQKKRKNMVHFYKGNLADRQNTEYIWNEIVQTHGPIHILINNAARVLGKRVDELKI